MILSAVPFTYTVPFKFSAILSLTVENLSVAERISGFPLVPTTLVNTIGLSTSFLTSHSSINSDTGILISSSPPLDVANDKTISPVEES